MAAHTAARVRLLLFVPLVAVLLAACAQDEDPVVVTPGGPGAEEPQTGPTGTTSAGGGVSGQPSGTPVAADLTITVDDGAGAVTTYTLTCEPAGGDHPDPAAACAALAAAWPAAFEPVPADQACTQIYGGPQTATVTGTIDGQPVDASFNRTDGCQINRWESLTALLGAGGAS